MSAPNDGPDGYKLFVGSLPSDCTSEELHSVFSTYGIVSHVHMMNPHPRSGQRCAFLSYSTKSAGDDACKVLDNQYKIRRDAPHPIVVRWAKDSGYEPNGAKAAGDWESSQAKKAEASPDGHKLFVGGLPHDVSEEELRIVFDTYGVVQHCHLMGIHPKSGQRCAFVYYKTQESAQDAIKVLDKIYKIRENALHPIQVRWANKDSLKSALGDIKGVGKGEWPTSQRPDWANSKGDEYWTKGRSDYYGKGAWIGKGKEGKEKGKSWSSWEDTSAWSSWPQGKERGWHDWGKGCDRGGGWGESWDRSKGSWQGDAWLDDGWSHHNGHGKGRDGAWKGTRQEPRLDPTGTKLYVANLPEDIQESAIEYVFGTYGTVEKVHLMTGKVKQGSISAFVEYGDSEEASTAIMSLDNKYEIRKGYGPLQVRLANASASSGKGKSYRA